MKLYYINLGLHYYKYILKNNTLRYEFQQRTNYIDDYFSKAARKIKFETDGTFNMIFIALHEDVIEPCSIVPDKVLLVELPLDKIKYDKAKNSNECDYYLDLLEIGFKKAANYKSIPLDALLNLINVFKQDGCKNEWIYKKKKFKEHDIEILLSCEFTTNYFQLVIAINQLSSKRELLKGVIMRTDVGVSIHERMYKDIIVNDKNILITDISGDVITIIDKQAAMKGFLKYTILGDDELVRTLSYQL